MDHGLCTAKRSIPDNVQAFNVSDEQTTENQDPPLCREQVEDTLCSSGLEIHAGESDEMVITSIHAAGISLRTGQISAGFYAAVQHSGCGWRTDIVPVSVGIDIVEWNGPIPIPSDLSAIVCLEIYASFELQPMLGDGEQLRAVTVTVGRLIDRSANDLPFTFSTNDGDDTSSCSSVLVKVERRQHKSDDPSILSAFDPYRLVIEPRSELQDVTNEGHTTLSRYRKNGERRDLERSIEQFERALDICPLDDACRAAAESNLAMAKFIHCRIGDSDIPIDVPLALYRNALASRPVGHLDRPSTLIQLAAVHYARFDKWCDEVDATSADALLHEAIDLSTAGSHENQAATSMLKLYVGRTREPVQVHRQLSVEQDSSASSSTDEDPCSFSALDRFRRLGQLDNLSRAISLLETSIRSTSGPQYIIGLVRLGTALLHRFDCLSEPSDLDQGILRLQDALDLIPERSVGKPDCLKNLGQAFLTRFKFRGELHDLEEATARYREAVSLSPDGHPNKPVYLTSLGNAFLIRFNHRAELSDLEQAILRYRDAVDLTPDGQPSKPATLNNFGNALKARFGLVGDLRDLEQAILRLSHAVDLHPESNPNKTRYLIDLGNAFMTRFQRLGELSDLSRAISMQVKAVNLTPDADTEKAVFLNETGNSFFIRFENLGELGDLEQAIWNQGEAVKRIPNGHPTKPSILNNNGNALLTRFNRMGEPSDVNQAISRFNVAIDLAPDGHPDKPTYFHNLGIALQARFRNAGELNDLERAISSLENAVSLNPDGNTNKPTQLYTLGEAFKTRFEQLGELSDLERAISGCRDAVDLAPEGHPDKPVYLNDLANTFVARFEHLGDPRDLEQATSVQTEALHLIPEDHPRKYAYLNNLCRTLITRFEHLGALADLDQAISTQRNAVELIRDGHPDKPALLDNLGSFFHTRFKRTRELGDVEKAIAILGDAIDLISDAHCDKPGCLVRLGGALVSRFELLGEKNDLEHAISKYGSAVDLTPDRHPSKPNRLSYLGEVFKIRFEHLGELKDLEEAISMCNDAVSLIPNDHSDNAGPLSNLGNALRIRFEQSGALTDLEQAILKQSAAVALTPDGDCYKPLYLNNLGNALAARFGRLGKASDLEQAISVYTEAVKLTPNGHYDMSYRLNNLGNAFLHRFRLLGELSDLEQAIARYRDAVDMTPHHIYKPNFLHNLGNTYLTRFKSLGDLGDLEEAISSNSNAVELIPDGDTRKPAALDNLGNALKARFQTLRELRDIQLAILRHQQAVELTPDDHPSKPHFLNNLTASLLARFDHLRDLSDLEQAVSRSRDAVDLVSVGDPYKPIPLINLGNAILTRFEQHGESSDLEEAISRYKEAVDLTPEGNPYKPNPLSNLGRAFKARFKHLGESSDLDQAISAYKRVIAITPDGHPDKPDRLNNLGTAFVLRFDHTEERHYLEQAISLFSQAACASSGPTTTRFRGSLLWISCARRLPHHTLLHAYSVAIGILPQLAWLGYTLTYRYEELKQATDVVRDAAAAALDSGNLETAVEWLEQGRSIVWGELFQLRGSYEELSSVHPDHARLLQQLSTALEHASVIHERISLSEPQTRSTGRQYTTESLEQEANRHRTLAIKRDGLLREIRGLPGFERFLLHMEFSQLRAFAHSGPVVILNAAETRCDALIVRADLDHVIHVPLRNFTFKQFAGLQNTLKSLLSARVVRYGESRVGQLAPLEGFDWESFLSPLWKCIAKPVLDALNFSNPGPGDLSRIFWCPTGPFVFLPIHAAGFYDIEHSQPGNKVSDFVISSYIPTLSILGPSPNPNTSQNGNLRFLAVRQPLTDGLFQLPGVETELDHIEEIIRNSPARPTLLQSCLGTVEEILLLMKNADWVHFACHGVQDGRMPAESGLCLADGRRLKVTDVIALSRPQGGLAFLSACQTATGDEVLSDEAIHIASGMLFAGYRSVIGTMWSISDRLAPDVARDLYEQLFRNDTMPDYRDAARALQEAVRNLQESGASFYEWLPFIHVGL